MNFDVFGRVLPPTYQSFRDTETGAAGLRLAISARVRRSARRLFAIIALSIACGQHVALATSRASELHRVVRVIWKTTVVELKIQRKRARGMPYRRFRIEVERIRRLGRRRLGGQSEFRGQGQWKLGVEVPFHDFTGDRNRIRAGLAQPYEGMAKTKRQVFQNGDI
jgi:hypothetical protein